MLVSLVLVVTGSVSAVAERAYERIRLTEPPAFVTSFLQAEDGSSLLVTNPAAATVVRHSLMGARIEEVSGSTDFDPSGLASFDGGYLVQSGQARFAVLPETRERGETRFATRNSAALLKSETTVELESLRLGRDLAHPKEIEGDIVRMNEWTPIGASTLVANAGDLLSDGHWRAGELEAAAPASPPTLLAQRRKRIFLGESPLTEAKVSTGSEQGAGPQGRSRDAVETGARPDPMPLAPPPRDHD